MAAPGYSEGSTVFFLNADLAACDLLYEAEAVDVDPSLADEERPRLVALSADVIFKGSVGRTDLPGGDQVQMWATLRFLASAINPDTVLVDLLPEGTKELTLDALLVIDGDKTKVGTPTVKGAVVKAKVVEAEVKGDKIRVIRYKAKKRVHKENGHRQKYSRIEITSIK